MISRMASAIWSIIRESSIPRVPSGSELRFERNFHDMKTGGRNKDDGRGKPITVSPCHRVTIKGMIGSRVRVFARIDP